MCRVTKEDIRSVIWGELKVLKEKCALSTDILIKNSGELSESEFYDRVRYSQVIYMLF